MGNADNEIKARQQIAMLEGKNRVLLEQLRKAESRREILVKEKELLLSRTLGQRLSEKIHKKRVVSGLAGASGENITWILFIDGEGAVELSRSFSMHHPRFDGKIIEVVFSGFEDKATEVTEALSAYDPINILQIELKENTLSFFSIINKLVDEIVTDWILCIGNDFRLSTPFLSEIDDELQLSGCHFLNLCSTFSDSLKCIRQRVSLDSEWDLDGERMIVLPPNEGTSQIPDYTRLFTADSGIFRRDTFIEFGRYREEYGSLCGFELSARIGKHNYAIANFSRPVLSSRTDRPLSCSETELQKYNSEVGKLEFSSGVPEKKRKVAVIIDEVGWAYYNIAVQLKKTLTQFDIDIYGSKYANSIVELFFAMKEYDVVHVLWRGILQFLDPGTASIELYKYRMSYSDFKKNYLDQFCLTTAVYDHLYLDEDINQVTDKILSLVDDYTVSSEKLFDIYSERYEKKPVEEITDGVDLEKFVPYDLDRFNHIGERPICIGWVGNSVFWGNKANDLKGVHTILNPAIDELKKEGYNLIKCFADKQERTIPHDEMPGYYSKIDLYICTSSIEGTPNPVLEAMACGVPVISTNVGVVPEVFGEYQKNFILESRDIGCLKETIKRMLSNPENLKKCSLENLQQIQQWNWKKKCEQYGRFFSEAYRRKVHRRME